MFFQRFKKDKINCASIICASLMVGMGALPGWSSEEVAKKDSATFAFSWENDSFAKTDRNYTNGMRVSVLSGAHQTGRFSRWFAKRLGADKDDDAVIRRGLALGHSLYTPENIGESQRLENQHPYASWLYVELTPLIQQAKQVDQFTLQIGLIGPSSEGEWIQNTFHELIDASPINGWDNQIGDELTLGFSWDRQLKRIAKYQFWGTGLDVTPSAGFSLSTVQTDVKLGLTARIGQDLDVDYGPPRVRPSLSGANFFTPKDRFSWYVFGGIQGRWVPYNRFYDGSLFKDENNIDLDRKPFVADLQAGIAVQLGNTQIAFTAVNRTRQYTEQTSAQRFGAFSLSRRF